MFDEEKSLPGNKVDEISVKTFFLILGTVGNALNIFVLHRRRPTTTNIYLSGISAVDLLRVVLNYTRTLDYYERSHFHFYYYWKFRGIIDGITFSCPPMSLFLIVVFTLNRYSAISDPLRRHKFNTKTVARLTIVVIVIFCVTTRIPVILSRQFLIKDVGYNNVTEKYCDIKLLKNYTLINTTVPELHVKAYDVSKETINGTQLSNLTVLQLLNHSLAYGTSHTFYNDYYHVYDNDHKNYQDYFEEERKNCHKVKYYNVFRKKRVSQYYTIIQLAVIMGILPIAILIFFNIRLIFLLKTLTKTRLKLTSSIISNTSSGPGNHQHGQASWVSKENQSIIKLIIMKSIVTICRIPHIILMFTTNVSPDARKWIVIFTSFGLDFNAAINFFLFCLLSDNYRKELRLIFEKYKPKKRAVKLRSRTQKTNQANGIAVIEVADGNETINERSCSVTSTSTNYSSCEEEE